MRNIAHKSIPPSLNLEIINEAKDVLGDRFQLLLNRFITDTNGLLSTIEFSRASNDYRSVTEAAHSLKSASCQMGAMQMQHISGQIEGFLHNKKTITTIAEESALDAMIVALRSSFADYQTDILQHL